MRADCDRYRLRVRLWQILVKIIFQSLFGSLLNYHYGNENVSLRHLSWICITSILTTIYSLKICSVYGRSCRIYSPKSFGFFRKEKKCCPRPTVSGSIFKTSVTVFTIRTSQPANNICIYLSFVTKIIGGALGPIRNRKTVEKNHPKPKKKFDQNRMQNYKNRYIFRS